MTLSWPVPHDLALDKIANLERGWNASSAYSVLFRKADASGAARIEFAPKSHIADYFREVALGPRTPLHRWLPIQEALDASAMYVAPQYDAARAAAAATRLVALDPHAGSNALMEWFNTAEEALMFCPRERVASIGDVVEGEFVRRLGVVEPLTFVGEHQAFVTHQMIEFLGMLTVMPGKQLSEWVKRRDWQELMAGGAHSHGVATHFTIPLAISFPELRGQVMKNVSWSALFVLDKPVRPPLVDARHRDIWNGYTGAWYGGDGHTMWQVLRPKAPVEFVRWYVAKVNALLRVLGDLSTTATLRGVVRPSNQVGLTRTVLALETIVGRCLITTDAYARSMWAMLALARFDDLGWEFKDITSEKWMTNLMEPLRADPVVADLVDGLNVWHEVMQDIIGNTAGTWDATTGKIALLNGKSVRADTYAGDYLKSVRDTIHKFKPEKIERELGLHRGTLPISLSQLVMLLWLRALTDPSDLIRPFKV